MSETQITPNQEFLDDFLSDTKGATLPVLLPHERAAVDGAMRQQRDAYNEIIDEKLAVSGGDDWHDGQFTSTDNQAKVIANRVSAIKPFVDAPTIDYPQESEPRATLGSRVIVSQNGYEFPIDIVGFREGHPEDLTVEGFEDEVMAVSLESPLANAVVGAEEGDEVSYEGAGRQMSARLVRIDQLGIRDYFMSVVDLHLEED